MSALSADRQASKQNMIFVYAIKNVEYDEIYVGMTNDLKRRLEEHNRGQSKYTRKYKDFKLIYYKEFPNYKEGRKHEKYLKSGHGKEFLKSLLLAGIV